MFEDGSKSRCVLSCMVETNRSNKLQKLDTPRWFNLVKTAPSGAQGVFWVSNYGVILIILKEGRSFDDMDKIRGTLFLFWH